MNILRGFSLSTLLLLGGCATAPLVIDSTHPASIDAAEASTPAARSSLRADAPTLRTRELFAQRQRQAEAAEAETPIDKGTAPETKDHEHHH